MCIRDSITRADQGSNYTSNAVKKFLNEKGIRLQLAAIHTPHQIRRGELNHAILNATMRAIMMFAHAPRNTWALARRYAALLNNFLATKYNKPDECMVPWNELDISLDQDALLPFGCQVVVHRAKEQVDDGHVDGRGLAGCFVGWKILEGEKAVSVLMPNDEIIDTAFFKADITYFPWRPDGQRRLLNNGTFGDEGEKETARIFEKLPERFSFHDLVPDVFDPDDEIPIEDEKDNEDETEDTYMSESSPKATVNEKSNEKSNEKTYDKTERNTVDEDDAAPSGTGNRPLSEEEDPAGSRARARPAG